MTCRQLENEPLADYVKRFKGNQDSMAQNMGTDFLKDFVKNTKQYADETDTDKQDEMQKGLYAQWTAYMLMKNSDQGKNGSLMTSLTKRAQELYHIVGTPTIELFKTLIKMNAIKNCPVTTEDVNNAKKIFGADMLSLRGKLVRHKSTPVREDVIEIPEELFSQNRKIDLWIDIMYVNKCGFMTMIDQTIQFRRTLPIENRTHEECYCVLDMVLQLYDSIGFHIRTIHCDGEFRSIMDKVKDNLGVCMNFTNALDHVPSEAERNNRTIKERVRA
jgi:hypothetical protein